MYEQAHFEGAFRRAQLVTTLRTDRTEVAPPSISPAYFAMATGTFTSGNFNYVDNVAIGPIINSPEPACVAAFVFCGVGALFRHDHRRRLDEPRRGSAA